MTNTVGMQSNITRLCISDCNDDLFTSKFKSIFVNFLSDSIYPMYAVFLHKAYVEKV